MTSYVLRLCLGQFIVGINVNEKVYTKKKVAVNCIGVQIPNFIMKPLMKIDEISLSL